jgi:hypothetical protein
MRAMKLTAVIRKDGIIVTDAVEDCRVASSVLKMKESVVPNVKDAPFLAPLDEAVRPYHGVTVRMLRARISSGLLPTMKIGRTLPRGSG